jgi:hypothetical protein
MDDDSTIRFDVDKGFGESYYLICPVCWNSGIKMTCWEDGTHIEEECMVCSRRERIMSMPEEADQKRKS